MDSFIQTVNIQQLKLNNMAKVVDEAFLKIYEDIKIEYPFCYRTPNGKNFFRYIADGRYEYISFESNRVTMGFGSRANSIDNLLSDDNFYLKVLANINTVINNEDFEFQRSLYMTEYDKYLQGDKYLAFEVQKVIEKKRKEEESGVTKENNDIIRGNQTGPEPF